MVRFSDLIAEQRWIKELDINPLIASPERLLALDARVVVYGPEVKEEDLPKIAIRPYRSQYTFQWKAKNGQTLTIRPIRPEDEPLLVKFHECLSDRTVYMSYFQQVELGQRVAHERLARICHCDYDREISLIAVCDDPRIVGLARLSKMHGMQDGRLSALVADQYQSQGIGSELMSKLVQIAREEKLCNLTTTLTSDNQAMHSIFKKLGFTISPDGKNQFSAAKLELNYCE